MPNQFNAMMNLKLAIVNEQLIVVSFVVPIGLSFICCLARFGFYFL